MSFRPHILHLHSSFSLGGKEARAVRLMNAWGDRARHTIVSGVDGQYGARDAIAAGVPYEIAQDPPPLTGRPSVARFEALAKYMRRFDLVLTYNWGAMDGVMARRAFAKGAPPLIHHEDGFNADESGGLKIERNLYRRIALPAAHALVVPSQTLEDIAFKIWKQPRERVRRIANGIPTALYARKPKPNAIPGLKKKAGELVIGTLAGLREVKALPTLVAAVGGLGVKARLVIVGEGPEREAIIRAGQAMGLSDRLVLPGFLPEPHRYVGLFDIFALSSLSEQFPIAVVEAMAAGLPVSAPPVGDVARMVSDENRPYLARAGDAVRLRDSLVYFVDNPDWRTHVGSTNQAKARAEYDEDAMIAAYAALYGDALARARCLSLEQDQTEDRMRGIRKALLVTVLALPATTAWAQYGGAGDTRTEGRRANESLANTTGVNETGSAAGTAARANCNGLSGVQRMSCFREQKKRDEAAAAAPAGKLSKADATLVNATNAAGQAKLDARDFAGAVAEYQKGIDASPKNPARHLLYAGLAVALRRQGIAAFNTGERPTPPAPGASNDVIRAYNAAVASAVAQRSAATLPIINHAIEVAAQAAALADGQANKAADPSIGLEMREDASLLYRIDRAGVLATPRASVELEADWLRRWLVATNPLAESLAAKYGVAVAANLVAKDPAAGLKLADEVKARTGNDADGAMGYAEIVVAAKTPAGDPRRAAALAGLNAADAAVVDGQARARLAVLKTALAAK